MIFIKFIFGEVWFQKITNEVIKNNEKTHNVFITHKLYIFFYVTIIPILLKIKQLIIFYNRGNQLQSFSLG